MKSKRKYKRKPLPEYAAKRKKLKHLYPDRDCTLGELARRVGVSVNTLRRWIDEEYPEKIKRGARPPSPERLRFGDLYRSRQFTYKEMADILGVSLSTINNWRHLDFATGSAGTWLKFIELYERDHYTPSELARAIGCHRNSIYRFMKRYAKQWPGKVKDRREQIQTKSAEDLEDLSPIEFTPEQFVDHYEKLWPERLKSRDKSPSRPLRTSETDYAQSTDSAPASPDEPAPGPGGVPPWGKRAGWSYLPKTGPESP